MEDSRHSTQLHPSFKQAVGEMLECQQYTMCFFVDKGAAPGDDVTSLSFRVEQTKEPLCFKISDICFQQESGGFHDVCLSRGEHAYYDLEHDTLMCDVELPDKYDDGADTMLSRALACVFVSTPRCSDHPESESGSVG